METLNCILTRRSVRRFVPGANIDKDTILELIKAAQYAPSAHNSQPWEFVVVEDKKFLEELPTHQPWTAFAKGASCAIVVCCDKNKVFKDDIEGKINFADIDCSMATQNLLLAAHDKGLGATICAIAPIEKIMAAMQERLKLPKHIRPVSIVILGHPEGEVKQPHKRFYEEKIHWEKW